MEINKDQDRIEKVVELAAPLSRVWRALTDHEEFGSWFNVVRRAPGAVVRPERRELWHQRLGYATGCAVGIVTERVWPF